MVDIVALNQKILYFTQKGYLISHRNHGNHRKLILKVIGAKDIYNGRNRKVTEKRKNLHDLRNLHEDKHAAWQISVISVISV